MNEQDYRVPGEIPRVLMRSDTIEARSYSPAGEEITTVSTLDRVNIVTSQVKHSERHAPVLDIDFNVELVPSTTTGHFHLYLDKTLTWRQYKKLLRALDKAGIIEHGYYVASVRRRFSAVRPPWVRK